MSITTKTFRFNRPSPSFAISDTIKFYWPTTYTNTVNLDNYSVNYEVLGAEIKVYHVLHDGHNTNVEITFIDKDTDKQLFKYSCDVPDPSSTGDSSYPGYWVKAWIGHCDWEIPHAMNLVVHITVSSLEGENTVRDLFMTVNSSTPHPKPVICTPGEHKCTGSDLYVCNSEGTAWNLEAANSPICKPTGGCPDFWTDPVGAVYCWIITSIEATLQLTAVGFLTLIANINNFLINFGADLVLFINDPVTKIKDWMGDTWATITEVTSSISAGITAWWNTTSANIGEWWNSATEDAVNWVNGIAGTLGDIITHSWSEVTDMAWGTIEGFVNWTNEQLLSIWEGIQGWAGDMILGLIDSFQFGFNQGIEEQKNKRKK